MTRVVVRLAVNTAHLGTIQNSAANLSLPCVFGISILIGLSVRNPSPAPVSLARNSGHLSGLPTLTFTKVGKPLKCPGFLSSETGAGLGVGTEGPISMEMPNTHGVE